jgi:hypothetical protein
MNETGNEDQEARIDHGSTLIDMIDNVEPPARTAEEEEEEAAHRRFTAAEKGKGRAGRTRETITIDDDEEEDSIQITGMKRKLEVESEEEVVDEDETRLGAFSESTLPRYQPKTSRFQTFMPKSIYHNQITPYIRAEPYQIQPAPNHTDVSLPRMLLRTHRRSRHHLASHPPRPS